MFLINIYIIIAYIPIFLFYLSKKFFCFYAIDCIILTCLYYVFKRKKKMRQKDIAKILNISTSTVSRVLNNVPKAASDELTNKIWALAHETNYKFNQNARSLRIQSESIKSDNNKISCLYARSSTYSISFFNSLLRGFETEALKHNYSFLSKESLLNMKKDEFIEYLELTKNYPLLILGKVPQSFLHLMPNIKKPVIQAGINVNCKYFDRVLSNGYNAARQVMQYLFFCGHQYIAYFGETKNEIRYYGFRSSIDNLHLPFEENISIYKCELSVKGGYLACERFLKLRSKDFFCSRISAIFCANDETAIGAYKKLQESNVKIPKDISIMSIDDIDESGNLSPMLTTMRIPKANLGKIAALTLLSRIKGYHKSPLKIELPCNIVVRSSVQDLKNRSIAEKEQFKKLLENMTD